MTGRLATAAAMVALALPAGAQATVTIGSDLSGTPNQDTGLGTWANVLLEAGRLAPGGLRSPVTGTLVRWRIKAGPRTAPVALRVIRPLGGGRFRGAGTSSAGVPAANATTTFRTRLPISSGDLIGTDTLSGSVTQLDGTADPVASRLFVWFAPSLHDGAPGSGPNVDAGGYVNLVDADIEPTSGFRIKRLKSLRGGRVWIALKLPNPGRVRVLGAGDRRSRVRAVAAGRRELIVRPIGPRLRIRFTPIGGRPSTRSRRVTLVR